MPGLLAAVLLLAGPASAASAAEPWTPPTRLDAVAAIDVAVHRNSAAWLRPTGRATATLVWWSTSTGEPLATDARLRPDPTRLTLGTDTAGQPAAIVEYTRAAPRIYHLRPPTAPPAPGAAAGPVAVVPDPAGQVLPVATTRSDRPHAFGLRDGRISFARLDGSGSRRRDAVWLGTAAAPDARLVTRRPREPRGQTVVDTALGAGHRVAYTAIRTRGPNIGFGRSWWISPQHRQPRGLLLDYGSWEGGSTTGSRITVRGDGFSAAISISGSLGDPNGQYLFGFRSGLSWQGTSGEPAWRNVDPDGTYANLQALERGDLPQPSSSLLLDDGGYVGYAGAPGSPRFVREDDDGRACPRGATAPRCAVWWRPSTGPPPTVQRPVHDSPDAWD